MTRYSNETQVEYLDVRMAARYLGLATATLNRWRCVGTGPRWRKFGGSVRYSVADLETWAAAQVRHTTAGAA
jgi:predicted DNA-binding transcriptional regulator AlpA